MLIALQTGLLLSVLAPSTLAQTTLLPIPPTAAIPPLDSNAWNLVFVQSFEPNTSSNNLSAQGLNHSLLFAQWLASATSGKANTLRQIYALDPKTAGSNNLSTIESIEPFAVLNNLPVQRQLVSNQASAYDSVPALVQQILGNQRPGIYVLAMPASLINSSVSSLLKASSPTNYITPGNYNQYLVLTMEHGQLSQQVYADGISAPTQYPDLHLKSQYQCPQNPVTFSAKAPTSTPWLFNQKQKVYFVRHVEAHPTSNFENGNYVCQGAWRALGATKILRHKIKGVPDQIFTSNPDNLINCAVPCSYIRPTLTITPFAIDNNMPVKLAKFQWNDPASLATALFTQNSTYSDAAFNQSKTLVAWEHGNIVDAVKYLFAQVYQNPAAAKQLPDWSFTDYDSIWHIELDEKGNASFSNSCEGIASSALPTTCPSFAPYP